MSDATDPTYKVFANWLRTHVCDEYVENDFSEVADLVEQQAARIAELERELAEATNCVEVQDEQIRDAEAERDKLHAALAWLYGLGPDRVAAIVRCWENRSEDH